MKNSALNLGLKSEGGPFLGLGWGEGEGEVEEECLLWFMLAGCLPLGWGCLVLGDLRFVRLGECFGRFALGLWAEAYGLRGGAMGDSKEGE